MKKILELLYLEREVNMRVLTLDKTNILLPGKANELTAQNLLDTCLLAEKYPNYNELRFLLLLKFAGLKVFQSKKNQEFHRIGINKKQSWLISSSDIAFANSALDFLFKPIQLKDGSVQLELAPGLTKNLLPEIKAGRKVLYGPDDALTNLIFHEFITTETNLNRWYETKNESYFNKFLAALYRPGKSKKEIESTFFNGDKRQHFNIAILERNADIVKKLPDHYKKAILLFYNGCKEFMFKKFPHVFKPGEDGQKTDVFQSLIDLVAVLADNKVNDKPIIRQQLLYEVLDTLEKERIKAIETEEHLRSKGYVI